jgi:hypothetical protein
VRVIPTLAERPGIIGIFLARVIRPPPTTGNGARCSISVLNVGCNADCRCIEWPRARSSELGLLPAQGRRDASPDHEGDRLLAVLSI